MCVSLVYLDIIMTESRCTAHVVYCLLFERSMVASAPPCAFGKAPKKPALQVLAMQRSLRAYCTVMTCHGRLFPKKDSEHCQRATSDSAYYRCPGCADGDIAGSAVDTQMTQFLRGAPSLNRLGSETVLHKSLEVHVFHASGNALNPHSYMGSVI